VFWYCNAWWCVSKTKFQHFMHDLCFFNHAHHFTSFFTLTPSIETKNWKKYMVPKFNVSI
jgi:hypothetical protein